MKHYKHGGDRYSFARQYSFDSSEIIDFSVNTWPYEVPTGLHECLVNELRNISRYPDIHADRFCKAVSTFHDVPCECIVPAAGSVQLIYALCSSPGYSGAITFEPTFNEYRRAAEVFQKTHTSVFSLSPANYDIQFTSIETLLQPHQLIFLCHPNNPTGTPIVSNTIQEILKQAEQKKCLLVVDEAFIDFLPDCSVAYLIERHKDVIVLRSLTKYFGLAGLRVGYALAHPETAEWISRLLPPWSLNALALCAGEWALNHSDYFDCQKDSWLKETRRMMNALKKHKDIEVYPSATIFFLFRVSNRKKANKFFSYLGHKGMMIRHCNDYSGLDQTFFRIGSKTQNENEQFLNTVDEFFSRKTECRITL